MDEWRQLLAVPTSHAISAYKCLRHQTFPLFENWSFQNILSCIWKQCFERQQLYSFLLRLKLLQPSLKRDGYRHTFVIARRAPHSFLLPKIFLMGRNRDPSGVLLHPRWLGEAPLSRSFHPKYRFNNILWNLQKHWSGSDSDHRSRNFCRLVEYAHCGLHRFQWR